MELTSTSFFFGHAYYQPTILPVDYGGTLAYAMELVLMNGRRLSHSSFELEGKETMSEEERFTGTLEKIAREVELWNVRPRCDFLDAKTTAAYRAKESLPPVKAIVSACLCGERCRYDGGTNAVPLLVELADLGEVIPVCPECAGGLPCPRVPCERDGERIFGKDGTEQTEAFLAGAKRTLQTAKLFGVTGAVLKERSPSCGVHELYDGSFSGKRIPGEGMTAALLRQNGIALWTEEEHPYGAGTA